MRYEMVLEGFGMDRILTYGDEIVTCVSANKLARINGLGEVEQVYPLGEYELHHDINYGRDGTVVALVEQTGAVACWKTWWWKWTWPAARWICCWTSRT